MTRVPQDPIGDRFYSWLVPPNMCQGSLAGASSPFRVLANRRLLCRVPSQGNQDLKVQDTHKVSAKVPWYWVDGQICGPLGWDSDFPGFQGTVQPGRHAGCLSGGNATDLLVKPCQAGLKYVLYFLNIPFLPSWQKIPVKDTSKLSSSNR